VKLNELSTSAVEVTALQIAAGAQGITVSTLKEAEQFFYSWHHRYFGRCGYGGT
jgi:hypothetical protein